MVPFMKSLLLPSPDYENVDLLSLANGCAGFSGIHVLWLILVAITQRWCKENGYDVGPSAKLR